MYPLIDASEHDPECGGYGYLDPTDGGATFHPGIDFNALGPGDADLGAKVVAIAPMRLAKHCVDQYGYGTHQYWTLTEGPYAGATMLIAHLSQVEHVMPDAIVGRGDQIAECGNSGGYRGVKMWAHLHCEFFRGAPPSWGYWPRGVSKDAVEAMYYNPYDVIEAYNNWTEGPVMSNGEHALIDTVRELNMDAGEATEILRVISGLNANHTSITQWIEEIGAWKARVAELEAALNASGVDPNAKASDE
jgi:murein DD-endopeptidase MepM/ murein hydrolase activator NlpD